MGQIGDVKQIGGVCEERLGHRPKLSKDSTTEKFRLLRPWITRIHTIQTHEFTNFNFTSC